MGHSSSPPRRRRPSGRIVLLLPFFCLACTSVTVQRFQPITAVAPAADDVTVLLAFPSSPYRALARIEIRDRGLGRTEAQLRQKLLAAASELGAEAVVLDRTTTRRTLGGFLEPFVLYDDLVVSGTAIVQQPVGST